MELTEVPGRELILIHPANHAMKELKGCIAPVTELTGDGEGIMSRASFSTIKMMVFPPLAKGQEVWLKIEESQESIYSHYSY